MILSDFAYVELIYLPISPIDFAWTAAHRWVSFLAITAEAGAASLIRVLRFCKPLTALQGEASGWRRWQFRCGQQTYSVDGKCRAVESPHRNVGDGRSAGLMCTYPAACYYLSANSTRAFNYLDQRSISRRADLQGAGLREPSQNDVGRRIDLLVLSGWASAGYDTPPGF